MNQQITILVVIDQQAALQENSLKNNIYLIDNLSEEGSRGEGSGKLVTAIRNGYWSDGSQADEAVFNWLALGVNSLPPTLPRAYSAFRNKMIGRERLRAALQDTNGPKAFSPKEELDLLDGGVMKTALQGKALNLEGGLFDQAGDSLDNLSFLPPQISDITGEAVEEGIIFPAQYGTPVPIKDGWYWSATTDTSKTGLYSYTLHITLYKREGDGWLPVKMEHEAWLEVTTFPQRNGFTGAGIGFLPL